jgi:hypothetical protein
VNKVFTLEAISHVIFVFPFLGSCSALRAELFLPAAGHTIVIQNITRRAN